MSKPADIPQSVWDEALRQWRIGRGLGTIDIISRAILAEREACADFLEQNHTAFSGEPADPMMPELIEAIRSR